jgi:beta-phosphoglucomutase
MPRLADFHAVAFDMDGTLTPNMHLHAQAFATFIQKYNLPTPDAVVEASLSGKRNSEIFPVLFGRDLPADELARYADEKEALYRALIDEVHPIDGLYDFLAALDRYQMPAAVATSAPHGNVAPTLQRLNLPNYFSAITLGSEVVHGKPAQPHSVSVSKTALLGCKRCAPPACTRWPLRPRIRLLSSHMPNPM